MTRNILKFVLYLVAIVSAQNKCPENMDNLSQGNVRLSKSSWTKFKKQNKIFVLGISDSKCTTCC